MGMGIEQNLLSELALKALNSVAEEQEEPGLSVEARMELTREMAELMKQPRDFEVGDFVEWKSPHLVAAKYPRKNLPALVVQVLEKPIRAGLDKLGSNFFNFPLDTVVLVYDEDGDSFEYHLDSRRLKKAEIQ